MVCKTVHQMAMAKCGFMFSKKLTSNLRAKDVLDSGLMVQSGEGEGGLFRRAGQVVASLNTFLNSPCVGHRSGSSKQAEHLPHPPLVW